MSGKTPYKTLCLLILTLLIFTPSFALAQNPPITYKIDIIPLPPDVDINPSVKGINNLGMAIGVYRLLPEAGGNLEGFLYDQPNDTFYNLSQLPSVQSQLPANWSIKWPDAINDRGDVLLEIEDTSGNENVAVMETGLSSDPNDWIVTILPNLGSSKVWGADINSVGDVVAVYHRPDGTKDIYVYNPWLDTPSNPNPPITLGIQDASSAAFINDVGQVHGVDKNTPGVAFIFDLATNAFQFFDVNSTSSQPITGTKGFNNAGVFCGHAGFGPSNESRVYRYTNQLEIIPWNSGGNLFSKGLNNSGDLALTHSWTQPWKFGTLNFGDVYLLHTGFSPDFTEMTWNLDDMIDENDPLRDFWLNEDTNKSVFRDGVSDRSDSNDASGYPQLACGVKTISIRRNRVTVVDDLVILTPIDAAPPSGGDSATYSSADTPLAIPDNNPGGVASDIAADDHVITILTVNLDISHPRTSDLDVYLIGPAGGPPIQLFDFSGDNDVSDFNGTSALGQWRLEVYDTRKKKTGTLNSWSITVEY